MRRHRDAGFRRDQFGEWCPRQRVANAVATKLLHDEHRFMPHEIARDREQWHAEVPAYDAKRCSSKSLFVARADEREVRWAVWIDKPGGSPTYRYPPQLVLIRVRRSIRRRGARRHPTRVGSLHFFAYRQ